MQVKNSVKLDIRPLEAKGLFTIRHVNSSVESYCIPDPDQKNTKGKVVIIMDIDDGITQNPAFHKKIIDKTANINLKPANAIDLPIIYNENIIKYNPQGATEITLKFIIPGENIFYSDGEKDDNNASGFAKINTEFSRDDIYLQKADGSHPAIVLSEK